MSNEQKYSVMTVKDIFWKILGGWKAVLILAVIGAVAGIWFSGRSYNNAQNRYNEYCDNLGFRPDEEDKALKAGEAEQKAYADKRAETWKGMLTGAQQSAVKDLFAIKKLIAETDRYISGSVYMNVDAYNIDYFTKVYQVSSDIEGLAGSLVTTYNTYISNGSLIEELAGRLGWKDNGTIYSDLLTVQVVNGTQLKIYFFCGDADTLKQADTEVENILQEKKAEYAKQYGNHTIECVDTVIGKRSDLNVANTQNTVQARQTSYTNQVNSSLNTFKSNPAQYNYYNYLENVEDGGTGLVKAYLNPNEEVINAPVKRTRLYAVAGALAGIILAVAAILCIYMANGKLLKSEEMVYIYDLPYLGCLIGGKKRLFIDRWIRKQENGNDGPYDADTRAELIASKLAAVCKEKQIEQIAIIGTKLDKAELQGIEKLTEKLNKLGVKAQTAGNIITGTEATDIALKAGNVFIAETIGRSGYKDIEKELNILKGCNISIIGAGCID